MKKLAVLFTFFSASYLVAGCSNEAPASKQDPTKAPTSMVAVNGKKVFTTYCIACHGKNGKLGFSGAKNLTESTMTVEEIVEIVTHGRKAMTGFEKLMSEEEIKAVSEYAKTFQQ